MRKPLPGRFSTVDATPGVCGLAPVFADAPRAERAPGCPAGRYFCTESAAAPSTLPVAGRCPGQAAPGPRCRRAGASAMAAAAAAGPDRPVPGIRRQRRRTPRPPQRKGSARQSGPGRLPSVRVGFPHDLPQNSPEIGPVKLLSRRARPPLWPQARAGGNPLKRGVSYRPNIGLGGPRAGCGKNGTCATSPGNGRPNSSAPSREARTPCRSGCRGSRTATTPAITCRDPPSGPSTGACPPIVAGIRALLMQSLHPGVLAGVHDHSDSARTRWAGWPGPSAGSSRRHLRVHGRRRQAATRSVLRLHESVRGTTWTATAPPGPIRPTILSCSAGCTSPSSIRFWRHIRSGAAQFPAAPTPTSASGRRPAG